MRTVPTNTGSSPLEALREARMLRGSVRDLVHVALGHDAEVLERAWPSADISSEVENLLGQLTAGGILIPQPDQVRDYLLQYPDIINVVRALALDASERLGNTAQLSLGLHQDPEIAYQYLVLYVRQERYDDAILETIDDIVAPHEAALVSTSGWFLATTDFKPPVPRQ